MRAPSSQVRADNTGYNKRWAGWLVRRERPHLVVVHRLDQLLPQLIDGQRLALVLDRPVVPDAKRGRLAQRLRGPREAGRWASKRGKGRAGTCGGGQEAGGQPSKGRRLAACKHSGRHPLGLPRCRSLASASASAQPQPPQPIPGGGGEPACFFHSGISCAPTPMPRSSAASARSLGSAG